MASDRQQSSGAGLGWPSGRLPGCRSSPDAGPATRAASHRDGDLGAAGTRLLRPGGRQRLLGRPGRVLAAHDRCWAARQTLTDPTHVEAAAALRRQFQTGPPPTAGDHLVRDLAEYDRAFGVDFTTGTAASDGEVE